MWTACLTWNINKVVPGPVQSILVTGANGFLGQHLCAYLSKKGYQITATSRGPSRLDDSFSGTYISCDLSVEVKVAELIATVKLDVVIHTAAMSKPDECNSQKDACYLHNVCSTRYLAEQTKAIKSFFIYTSTDFIFGEGGPHGEDDIPDPLNYYGECKLKAEREVIETGVEHAIVRPVFIYGPTRQVTRPSFVQWVEQNLKNGKPIKVVGDQCRTPTFVYDICKGILSILITKKTGAWHLAGGEILSPFQMAVATARLLNLDAGLITEVTSANFPEPVRRAKQSGLKIEKAVREIDYRPTPFEDGLKKTFNISFR